MKKIDRILLKLDEMNKYLQQLDELLPDNEKVYLDDLK